MGIMFLSRKEAKGSSFRCLAIPFADILNEGQIAHSGPASIAHLEEC